MFNQKAYDVSKEIFEISKEYPNEENIHLPIKFGVRQDLFVQIFRKLGLKNLYKALCTPKGSILLQCEAKQGEEGDSLIRQYPRDASYSNVV